MPSVHCGLSNDSVKRRDVGHSRLHWAANGNGNGNEARVRFRVIACCRNLSVRAGCYNDALSGVGECRFRPLFADRNYA